MADFIESVLKEYVIGYDPSIPLGDKKKSISNIQKTKTIKIDY
jgi:hypothetical protein